MTDRRRINAPPSGTHPLIFASNLEDAAAYQRPQRTRQPKQHRKIFLRTGLTPSASGSSYLELQSSSPTSSNSASTSSSPSKPRSLLPSTPSLKLSCTVHGPKPLPRSAPFSPHLLLNTHIKFTPYASRSTRRGFVRDATERDLGVHLEAALRGVIVGERWPKSGVNVTLTVLETEEDAWVGDAGEVQGLRGTGMMTVLAGCVTAACAALVEAGIDCVDVVAGGMSAIVPSPSLLSHSSSLSQAHSRQDGPGRRREADAQQRQIVVDPCPSEHAEILAACVVGYLPSRDEITELWMKGDVGDQAEALIDAAVTAASSMRTVLNAVLKESMQMRFAIEEERQGIVQNVPPEKSHTMKGKKKDTVNDTEMTT